MYMFDQVIDFYFTSRESERLKCLLVLELSSVTVYATSFCVCPHSHNILGTSYDIGIKNSLIEEIPKTAFYDLTLKLCS